MAVSRKATNSKTQKERAGKTLPISETEQKTLFQKYIAPHLEVIKLLAAKYTDKSQDVDENYNLALAQMYTYIHTYDPEKSLKTWIYIVTKRACFNQNEKRAKYASTQADLEFCSSDALHQHGSSNIIDACCGTLADNLSDEVYNALMRIDPCRLSPFLLFAQGMKIREITQAEWRAGHLKRKSEDIVKSRIYWAKKELQLILKQHGISEASYTSAFSNK